MSLSETPVDSLALAIANSGFWERMAYFLPLIWLLSIEEAFTLGQKLARLSMQRFQEGEGERAPDAPHMPVKRDQVRHASHLLKQARGTTVTRTADEVVVL